MRLCDKWDGILIATQRSGPVYLRCDQIKIQFDKFAQRGALFKTLRPMVESVRNQNLLEIKLGDLPKDQKCALAKGDSVVLTCRTKDFEPAIASQFIGSKAGVLTTAIVSADANWFRNEIARELQTAYGIAPTGSFMDFYIDLLLSVSSYLGGAAEQYTQSNNKLILTIKVR